MSHPLWLPVTDVSMGRVLPFPSVARESQAASQSELGGALTFASAENLIVQYTHLLERIVRLAPSLSDDQRISLLGHAIAFEHETLDPLQFHVEKSRSFLSDLSARQARKRRRRQRRVKEHLTG